MTEKRPYRRPMRPNWWAHKPYLSYTLRELSGVAVGTYGAILLYGLYSLWSGPESYERYLQFLKTPLSLALHVFLLGWMVFHTVTWFQTLPKTMPKVMIGANAVPQGRITALAVFAAVICSSALVAIAVGVTR
jgi:fumarate reductase subunit C